MPQFEFRGTRSGAPVSGTRVATSREVLDAALRREQITPTRIVEKGREFAIPKPKVGGKVSSKELAIFTRQFSVMIDAGLPLIQCLEVLSSQQENKGFARALGGVRGTVESGSSLTNALRQYPRIFDKLYTNMVEAGEAGGILDTILQRLSTYIEKAVKLRRAVQSAMVYPVAVVVIAVGVVTLLLWKVVPTFATLFAGLDVPLPLPTRLVIGLSHFVATFVRPMTIAIGSRMMTAKSSRYISATARAASRSLKGATNVSAMAPSGIPLDAATLLGLLGGPCFSFDG
jgi:type IV pilus assembly protein PilC